jgi:hypothetical protein
MCQRCQASVILSGINQFSFSSLPLPEMDISSPLSLIHILSQVPPYDPINAPSALHLNLALQPASAAFLACALRHHIPSPISLLIGVSRSAVPCWRGDHPAAPSGIRRIALLLRTVNHSVYFSLLIYQHIPSPISRHSESHSSHRI